jgi:hypothetical protein
VKERPPAPLASQWLGRVELRIGCGVIQKLCRLLLGVEAPTNSGRLPPRDEAHYLQAFWCFVALMKRLGGNFDKEQAACQQQLVALRRLVQLLDPPLHAAINAAACADMLFCFRWVLVALKREFPVAEVPALWEVLWTNPYTPHLHLYVSLVLLEQRRCAPLLHVFCTSSSATAGLADQCCSTVFQPSSNSTDTLTCAALFAPLSHQKARAAIRVPASQVQLLCSRGTRCCFGRAMIACLSVATEC